MIPMVFISSPVSALQNKKLFFINLGGYQENRFQEQHYILMTVEENSGAALKKHSENIWWWIAAD
jgi:predicted lactoylglutathione lyase